MKIITSVNSFIGHALSVLATPILALVTLFTIDLCHKTLLLPSVRLALINIIIITHAD
jgi:hypothetical protein